MAERVAALRATAEALPGIVELEQQARSPRPGALGPGDEMVEPAEDGVASLLRLVQPGAPIGGDLHPAGAAGDVTHDR